MVWEPSVPLYTDHNIYIQITWTRSGGADKRSVVSRSGSAASQMKHTAAFLGWWQSSVWELLPGSHFSLKKQQAKTTQSTASPAVAFYWLILTSDCQRLSRVWIHSHAILFFSDRSCVPIVQLFPVKHTGEVRFQSAAFSTKGAASYSYSPASTQVDISVKFFTK